MKRVWNIVATLQLLTIICMAGTVTWNVVDTAYYSNPRGQLFDRQSKPVGWIGDPGTANRTYDVRMINADSPVVMRYLYNGKGSFNNLTYAKDSPLVVHETVYYLTVFDLNGKVIGYSNSGKDWYQRQKK